MISAWRLAQIGSSSGVSAVRRQVAVDVDEDGLRGEARLEAEVRAQVDRVALVGRVGVPTGHPDLGERFHA
jgi:hypothetical protein